MVLQKHALCQSYRAGVDPLSGQWKLGRFIYATRRAFEQRRTCERPILAKNFCIPLMDGQMKGAIVIRVPILELELPP